MWSEDTFVTCDEQMIITGTVLNATEVCLTSLLECASNFSQVLRLDTDKVDVQQKCNSKLFRTQSSL